MRGDGPVCATARLKREMEPVPTDPSRGTCASPYQSLTVGSGKEHSRLRQQACQADLGPRRFCERDGGEMDRLEARRQGLTETP